MQPDLSARIQNDFASHACDEVARKNMARIRQEFAAVASVVAFLCPPGREQATALTKLEEAMFWANAAISRPFPVSGS